MSTFDPGAFDTGAFDSEGTPIADAALAVLGISLEDCGLAPVQHIVVTGAAYLAGNVLATLSIVGGSVTADSRRSILRDATLELAPTIDYTLGELYGILTTPGVELAVSRGFMLPDGTTLMAALGRFVPDEPVKKRDAAGTSLSVTCSDVAVRVQRARWIDPYVIAAGTALATALSDLLFDRYPSLATAITADICPGVLAAQVVTDVGSSSDPWADAVNLAAAHGYDLYPDVSGVVTVRQVALPSAGSAVFTFARGATAITTEETTSSPLDQVYNGVIASAEGSEVETTVRGEAWDDNPGSPTYRYGPFGQVPYFYSSSLLADQDACETAAAKILAGLVGRVERLSWQSVVHPGLAPLDVVGIEGADGSTAYYVLDNLTIPLGVADAMSAVAREVSVAF